MNLLMWLGWPMALLFFVLWRWEMFETAGWVQLYDRAVRELHQHGQPAPNPTMNQYGRLLVEREKAAKKP